MVQLTVAEWEAGAQKGAFKAAARADPQATTVKRSAAATAGGKLFLANRIKDHGVFQAALVFAGDADRKVGYAAQKVGGPIQRIDNPEIVATLAAAGSQAAFLAHEAVI